MPIVQESVTCTTLGRAVWEVVVDEERRAEACSVGSTRAPRLGDEPRGLRHGLRGRVVAIGGQDPVDVPDLDTTAELQPQLVVQGVAIALVQAAGRLER